MTQSNADGSRNFSGDDYPVQELTRRIIGAFYYVYKCFGYGFLESAYRRALAVELEYHGLKIAQEVPFELQHRGVVIGFYRADLIVASTVIIEVKAGLTLDSASAAQLLNYLKVSRLPVGLVLHFGPRAAIKRIVASRQKMENL